MDKVIAERIPHNETIEFSVLLCDEGKLSLYGPAVKSVAVGNSGFNIFAVYNLNLEIQHPEIIYNSF